MLIIGNFISNNPHYFFRSDIYDIKYNCLVSSVQFVLLNVFIMSLFNQILIRHKNPDYSDFNHNLNLFGFIFLSTNLLLWEFSLWHYGEGNKYINEILNNPTLFKEMLFINQALRFYIILRLLLNLYYMRKIYQEISKRE